MKLLDQHAKQSPAVTIQYVVQYNQGYTNPGEQVVRATELYVHCGAKYLWAFSVELASRPPTLRTPRILRCLLDFWKIYEFLNVTTG